MSEQFLLIFILLIVIVIAICISVKTKRIIGSHEKEHKQDRHEALKKWFKDEDTEDIRDIKPIRKVNGGGVISVLTWNLYMQKHPVTGEDTSYKLEQILRKLSPDICCFQEYDGNNSTLLDNLKEEYPNIVKCETGESTINNVIISKNSIYLTDAIHVELSDHRRALVCTAEIDQNKKMQLICTHLSVESEQARQEELKKLSKHLDGSIGIIAGDFNMRRYPNIKGYIPSKQNKPTSVYGHAVDYILSRGFRILETSRPKISVSDHYPIYTLLKLK